MAAYYNENDPFAAAWLRELIKAGLIADGEVDDRSIADVQPGDVAGFAQCHFFAGIGGWSYALRLAGWPDDRPVWTGSCPCQPFSVAGKADGANDSRHLWPTWFQLIRQRKPVAIFGEQVASSDGLAWLDLVHADMEGADYAVGSVDLCAAGVQAPHIRQRIWFVADAGHAERRPRTEPGSHDLDEVEGGPQGSSDAGERRVVGLLADATRGGLGIDGSAPRHTGHVDERESAGEFGDSIIVRRRSRRLDQSASWHDTTERREDRNHLDASSPVGELGHAGSARLQRRKQRITRHGDGHRTEAYGSTCESGQSPSAWASDWIPCVDGKARPVEPGTFPLAYGVSARVGRLRGYGNAIVPQVAAEVIRAYMEIQ